MEESGRTSENQREAQRKKKDKRNGGVQKKVKCKRGGGVQKVHACGGENQEKTKKEKLYFIMQIYYFNE